MRTLRLLVVGGFTSYRALFNWLSPWVLIPTLVVAPLSKIVLFAYVGRGVELADDGFFLLGNALVAMASPCLFGLAHTIVGERQQQTLGLLLVAPVARVPLFLGRTIPIIANGVAVAVLALALGALLLGVRLPPTTWLPLLVAVAVSGFSCTGLGLATAALALRIRETGVLSLVVVGALLIFSGANIPLDALPGWMAAVSEVLPLRHGIAALRLVAAGRGLDAALPELVAEAAVGVVYLLAGLALLRLFERESRRRATLETW